MTLRPYRTQIFDFPYDRDIFDARLMAVYEEPGARLSTDIILDVDLFRMAGEPEPTELDGRAAERVRGEYVPHRLRFGRAMWVQLGNIYHDLSVVPLDAPARRLYGVLHWKITRQGASYLILTHQMQGEDMVLRARSCVLAERPGAPEPVEFVRRWAYSPAQAAGIVPERRAITSKYGGDPIAIVLDGQHIRDHFFIGGIRHQTERRPAVDDVLNLCEVPNPWALTVPPHANDRHSAKGEMSLGMQLDELRTEAEWVKERLLAGHKVLVHCFAGVNRSSTVCCAALMLLEGLTAEQALARVREQHPGCRPDPYHWFLLRQFEQHLAQTPHEPAADASVALRDALPVG